MDIKIMNVPKGMRFDPGLVLHLTLAVQEVAEDARIEIESEGSKINSELCVMVWNGAKDIPQYNRVSISKEVLWFLHCHDLGQDTKVYFVVGKTYDVYAMSDFPEIARRPHPSLK